MSELVHKCWAKSVLLEGSVAGAALSWTVARRGYLRIFNDQLRCGSWRIPYDDIEDAVLYTGWGLFLPGHILLVRTRKRTYKFGLNLGGFWKGEVPFPLKRDGYRIKGSRGLLVLRALLLALLGLIAWGIVQRYSS